MSAYCAWLRKTEYGVAPFDAVSESTVELDSTITRPMDSSRAVAPISR